MMTSCFLSGPIGGNVRFYERWELPIGEQASLSFSTDSEEPEFCA